MEREVLQAKFSCLTTTGMPFAIAEALLGYSLNTTDEDELRASADYLKEQKPLVQQYVMDQIFDKMIREEAWVAPLLRRRLPVDAG